MKKDGTSPLLKIGEEHSGRHIWLTCRHHACESCASYVLEGVLSYLLHVPNPFVRHCLVHVLPFIDIDGVEDGDQGKGRIPHDHNRDYQQQPIYNVTKALYQYTENRPILMGFDFHDPGKWGGYQEINDHWSIVEGPQPYLKPQRQFSRILEDVAREETLYSVQNNSVFGVDWNTQLQPSAWNFFFKRGAKVAFSLETPYFGDRAEPYSQDMLRHLGEKFAIAMQRYEEQYL